MPPAKALMALLAPPAKALMALLASLPSFIAAFCINLGAFCCVLHQLGGVLLRPALIWCHFAALCNDSVLSL